MSDERNTKRTEKKTEKKPLDDVLEKLTFDSTTFEKEFPSLFQEIQNKEMPGMSIDHFQRHEEDDQLDLEVKGPKKSAGCDLFSNFTPTAKDFIRRCSTDAEAVEIIEYLVKRGEVTPEERQELLDQVEREGVRSFGKKREWGYYERKAQKGEKN